MRMKTILLSTIAAGTMLLASCGGGGSVRLPTTNYEKAQFAFSGVEKSFQNKQSTKKGLNRKDLALKSNADGFDDALATLYGLYTPEDDRGDDLDELDYYQPPMIQFQYLKKVLEKVGDSYSFGTKYFDTMTGAVYVDMETGIKAEGEEHRYNYSIDVAIDLNIDANDLITADISFDINVARGNESYTTKWYVGMALDYDMKNQSPNYTLSMYTENDERELPYYKHHTYEYDYVNVKDGNINEWRKFCLTSDRRLVADADHTSFDAYLAEGIDYVVECFAWYKNNSLKKNNHLLGEKKATFGRELFGPLGLNGTDIGSDRFFQKEKTRNGVIGTCYQEFCQIAKQDIIYSLLTREDEDDHGEQSSESRIVEIRAMRADLSGGAENYTIPDVTIREMFGGYIDGDGVKTLIRLYYVDSNGGPVEEITQLDSLLFALKLQGQELGTTMELDEKISDGYRKLIELGAQELTAGCEIYFYSSAGDGVGGMMSFYYAGEIPSGYVKPTFPRAIAEMGVPEYEGEKIEFNYSENDGKYRLEISNTNYDEGEEYLKKLKTNGFRESLDYPTQANEILVSKDVDDAYALYVLFAYSKNETTFILTAWLEDIPAEESVFPTELSDIGVPAYEGEDVQFGQLDVLGENYYHLLVSQTSYAEIDTYWDTLLRDGFYAIDDPESFHFFHIDENGLPPCMKKTDNGDLYVYLQFTDTSSVVGIMVYLDMSSILASVSIVGDFNNWSLTEGCIEFTKTKDNTFILDNGKFKAGDKFKIVANHSWGIRGGYGYDDIAGIADYVDEFSSSGDEKNILVNRNLYMDITASGSDGESVTFSLTRVKVAG